MTKKQTPFALNIPPLCRKKGKQFISLFLSSLCIFSSIPTHAAEPFSKQNSPVSAITKNNYFFRADYFSLSMPENQDRLSLAGLHLAKKFSSGLYFGGGLYSAVAGQYSGFFALGGEAGWEHLIYRQ